MGGHNCNCATYLKYLKTFFTKKVFYLVVEYILNFSPESENFYFLENMLIYIHVHWSADISKNTEEPVW